MTRPGAWMDQAVCVGVPDAVLFPKGSEDGTGSRSRTLYDEARAVCAPCPVRQECLDDALATERSSHHYRHGIRGGLTPIQRANLARRLAKAAARASAS